MIPQASEWSSDGAWIAYTDPQGLRLVSVHGKSPKLFGGPISAFGFAKDSRRIYVLRAGPDRNWEIAAIGVPDGAETRIAGSLPTNVTVTAFSLHPEGKRFALTARSLQRSIWLLDDWR